MRKISATLILLLLLAMFALPFPMEGQAGVYNDFSGTFWCNAHYACLHEIGHKLDQDAGWVSHTQEFSVAVKIFLRVELRFNDPLALALLETPGVINYGGSFRDPQSEMYATIFRKSEGYLENTPETFRKFYDWDYAKILIDKYAR